MEFMKVGETHLSDSLELASVPSPTPCAVTGHTGKEYTKKECLYVYNWVTLLYSRDWHSTVNQLSFSKNNNKKKAGLLDYRCESVRIEFLHLAALYPETWPVYVVIQSAHTSLGTSKFIDFDFFFNLI